MAAYYNEIDPFAAAWLRNLITAGLIADGHVDERDIKDVTADDLRDFTQAHFFAGLGGWSHALRSAGWPDSRAVWTGSCPCQPFSAASQGAGFADERHLWPHFHWLIQECRPGIVVGEQVASPDGLKWLDLVQADMEGTDYAFAAIDLCAAGIGAPHIRQRLYWMGYDAKQGLLPGAQGGIHRGEEGARSRDAELERSGATSILAGGDIEVQSGRRVQKPGEGTGASRATRERSKGLCEIDPASALTSFWRDADWLLCRDGKFRPVEPGTFPLAYGVPARVGLLRAYGNAIVGPLAAEFIAAICECAP